MIRKLKTGEFRIYSRHVDPKTGKRRNLGTFPTREKAEVHERAVLQAALRGQARGCYELATAYFGPILSMMFVLWVVGAEFAVTIAIAVPTGLRMYGCEVPPH